MSLSTPFAPLWQTEAKEHVISYTDGRVADVDGVVRVRRLDVELQDVMDVGRVDVQ